MRMLLAVFSLLMFCSVQAQDKAPCLCCQADYRMFDFWQGSWDVFSQQEAQVGSSEVSIIQDSCIILENWTSAKTRFTGTSFNYFSRDDSLWHQLWLDNQGGRLELKGEAADGVMTLRSEEKTDSNGVRFYHQIQWTKQEDGSVHQVWTTHRTETEELINTLFYGIYRIKQ